METKRKQVAWCKKCHIVLGEPKENVDVKDLFHRCGGAGSPMQLGDIEIIAERKLNHIGTPCQGGSRHTDCIKEKCWCGCHKKQPPIHSPTLKGRVSLGAD